MSWLDSYFDNSTGVIQASSRIQLVGGGGTGPDQNITCALSPQNVTNITGFNNVYVNWVRFEYHGHAVTGGVGETYGYMTPGILPRDLALEATNASGPPNAYPKWEDYDDLRGWPLNRGKRHYYAYCGDSANSSNAVRMVFTYRPKKVLLLNRSQSLYVCVHNSYGQGIEGVLSIVASFKKGPE